MCKFFRILIQLYLVYPVVVGMYHFFVDRKREGGFLLLMLAIQISWSFFTMAYHPRLLGSGRNLATWFFPGAIFYFALGMSACRNYERIRAFLFNRCARAFFWAVLALVAIRSAFFIAGLQRYGTIYNVPPSFRLLDFPLDIPTLLVIFTWLLRVSQNLVRSGAKFWLRLGSYSLGIYLIHPFFQECLVDPLLRAAGLTSLAYFPIAYLLIAVCSIGGVAALRKLPGHQYVTG